MLQAQVISILREYGQRTTIRRLIEGTYNPADGGITESREVEFQGIGRLGTYNDALIDGTRITQKDRLLTFVPDDETFIPLLGDVVEYDGGRYSTVSFITRKKKSHLICYSIQVRVSPSGYDIR